MKDEILKIDEKKQNYKSLSKTECKIFEGMVTNKNYVIKPVEKGGAIVIWD